MARKTKITLSDSVSGDDLKEFDDLLDDGVTSEISSQSPSSDKSSSIEPTDTMVYPDFTSDDDVFVEKHAKSDSNDNICPFADKSMNEYSDVNEKMIEIFKDFTSDTKLTMANLSTVAQNEAYIKARWLSKMLAQKSYLKDVKREYSELVKRVREMVEGKSKTESFIKRKMNVDSIVSNDSNVKMLAKKVEDASMLFELYKEYYGIIKDLGYQIRNSIDTLNFERGM